MNLLSRTLCALLLVPALSSAQRITGTVRDSASHGVVAGAVVSVLDSAAHTMARGLTDAAGRYTLELPAGARSLRVVHIGFRPHVMPMSGVTTRSPLDVNMERLTTLLAAVEVHEQHVCSNDPTRAAALGLWEQARAGLLAAIVARDASKAEATIINYERNVDYESGRVVTQQSTRQSGQTTRPFVAADSAEGFAARGYAVTEGTTTRFFAPDADVLFDDSFARTHCFTLAKADAQHAGAIGLAFEPARGREALVEVKGVLWIESSVPALRSIEYHYTGPNEVLSSREGFGLIHFTTVQNGVVFIDEWKSRLPVFSDRAVSDRGRRSTMPGTIRRVEQYGETGGIVVSATWPDGVQWQSMLSPLTGVVSEEHSSRPLAGVLVSVPATGDTVVTDLAGQFTIFPLFPGKYQVAIIDTMLHAFVPPRTQQQVVTVVREGMNSVRPRLPSRLDAVRGMCSDTTDLDRTSILLGRAVMQEGHGKLPPGLMVSAAWLSSSSITMRTDAFVAGVDKQGISLDDAGRFSACGAPRARSIKLTLLQGKAALADTMLILPESTTVRQVLWRIPDRVFPKGP